MIPMTASADYKGEQTLLTTRPTRLIAFHYYVIFVFSIALAPVFYFLGPIETFGNVHGTLAGWSLDQIIAILFLILAVYSLARAELKRATTRYVITDNKIIRQDGILSKNTQMIPYTQLERVDLNQSFLQRILKIGTVIVDTGDDTMKIEMVPQPAKIQELLSQRLGRRAYVMQR